MINNKFNNKIIKIKFLNKKYKMNLVYNNNKK